jgi:hypothetical protein
MSSFSLTCKSLNEIFNNLINDEDKDTLVWTNIIINKFPALKKYCNSSFLGKITKKLEFKMLYISLNLNKYNKDRYENYYWAYVKHEIYTYEWVDMIKYTNKMDVTKRLYKNFYFMIMKSFETKIGDDPEERINDRARLLRGANIAAILGLTPLVELLSTIPYVPTQHDLRFNFSDHLPDLHAIEKVCENGDTDILKFALEKKIRIDTLNCIVKTIDHDHIECFKILRGNMPIEEENKSWFLSTACHNNSVKIVKYFINELKIIPTEHALKRAANSANLELVNLLLQANKDLSFKYEFYVEAFKQRDIKTLEFLSFGNVVDGQKGPFYYQSESGLKPYKISEDDINYLILYELRFHSRCEEIKSLIVKHPEIFTLKNLIVSYTNIDMNIFNLLSSIIKLPENIIDIIDEEKFVITHNFASQEKDQISMNENIKKMKKYLQSKGFYSLKNKYEEIELFPSEIEEIF